MYFFKLYFTLYFKLIEIHRTNEGRKEFYETLFTRQTTIGKNTLKANNFPPIIPAAFVNQLNGFSFTKHSPNFTSCKSTISSPETVQRICKYSKWICCQLAASCMFCPHTWTCSIGLFRCSFIAFLKLYSTVWRQAEARAMWHETLVWLKDAPQILPMDVSLWARWYISTRWAMVDFVGLAQLSYLGFYFLWTLHAFVLPSIRVSIAV